MNEATSEASRKGVVLMALETALELVASSLCPSPLARSPLHTCRRSYICSYIIPRPKMRPSHLKRFGIVLLDRPLLHHVDVRELDVPQRLHEVVAPVDYQQGRYGHASYEEEGEEVTGIGGGSGRGGLAHC